MSDWRTEGWRREERGGRDEDHGPAPGGRGGEPRQFGGGRGRSGDDDRGGQGPRSPDAERLDTGAGDQGQDRFGHSGGFQGGYNDQGGGAGFGPLSHGSTYGQGGATFGRSGWTSHDDGPRGGGGRGGRDDYGFRGQGGGGQQWAERTERSGGSYGQGDFGRSAQRSQLRTDQYDRNDRQGFGAAGRDGGPERHDPGHDHDHEPGYRAWREQQLSGHDRDYQRWRDEQALRYDEDYRSYRASRHETFSKGFGEWRSRQPGEAQPADVQAETKAADPASSDRPAGGAQASASSAASAGGVDANPDALRSVTDGGGPGDGRRDERHEADPKP